MERPNGYVRMTEEELWTLIEMQHKFRDDQRDAIRNAKRSKQISKYRPKFR